MRPRPLAFTCLLLLCLTPGLALANPPAPSLLDDIFRAPEASPARTDALPGVLSSVVPTPAPAATRPGAFPDYVSTTPAWTFEGNIANKRFGSQATIAGDVNGDGYSDAVALADSFSTTRKLYLYLGGPAGPALAPGYPVYLNLSIAQLAPAGDVNGDGFADLMVLTDGGGANFQLRIYYGGAGGYNIASPWISANNYLNGTGVISTCGDVNGDGVDDVMMGIPNYGRQQSICGTAGGTNYGRVDLYYGVAGTGPTAAPNWVLLGCQWENLGQVGASLGTAGDVNGDGFDDIVIGVPTGTPPGGTGGEGEAWVVYGNSGGLPLVNGFADLGSLAGSSTISGLQAGSLFGGAVCTAGDVTGDGYADIAVGAPTEDYTPAGMTNNGAARVFAGSAGGITSTVQWYEVGPVNNTNFGATLEPAGDIDGDGLGDLLIGPGIAIAQSGFGGLYINTVLGYPSGAGTYSTAGDIDADGLSDIVVGDALFSNGESFEGRIVFHRGRGNGPWPYPTWESTTALTDPGWGWSVGAAGDFNADGFDDVLFGAPNWDNAGSGETDNGLILVAWGGINGVTATPSPDWAAYGSPGDQIGVSVAGNVDFNGDGVSDVVTGGANKALVWYGKSGGPTYFGAADVTLAGPAGSGFGASVCVGDFNGDGYGDVVVGAPLDDPDTGRPFYFPIPNGGRAYMYLGSPSGLGTTPAWTGQGGQDDENFGTSVAGLGDINGDGWSDLVVGAPGFDAPCGPFTCVDSGRLFEFHGGGNAPYLTFAQTVVGSVNDGVGQHIAHAGDVNGDGYADIISGTPFANGGTGRADVYAGGSNGLNVTPIWSQAGIEAGGAFGSSVSTAGDQDGDGLSDVFVGSVFEDNGGPQDRGAARVFCGPLSPGTPVLTTMYGTGLTENIGHALACAGDVDEDGWPDLVAGGPGLIDAFYRQGRVSLYSGAQNQGRMNVTWATKSTNARIPFLGPTETGGFNLLSFARSAAGRTRMKLQWNVRGVVGLPNTPALFGSSSYLLSSAPGAFGSYALVGAPIAPTKTGAPYSWRARSLSRSVYFPNSTWFQPPLNGAREIDLRGNGTWVAVQDELLAPATFAMSDAFPNPTRGRSELSFTLPTGGDVSLAVLDLQGRRVRTLAKGTHKAGVHRAAWDGRGDGGSLAPAGLYFYVLEMPGRAAVSRKVAVIH